MKKLLHVQLIGLTLFFSMVAPVFAEPAPVYDVDSMQFEAYNGPDQDNYPPPPQGQDGSDMSNQLVQEDPQSQPQSIQDPPIVEEDTASMTVDQRLRRIEQQITNFQRNDLYARLETLQTEVQTLRGQIEQVSHQLELVQNQQKMVYAELDRRLGQGVNSAKQPMDTPEAIASQHAMMQLSSAVSNNNVPRNKLPTKPLAKPATTAAADPAVQPKTTSDQPNVAEEQQIYQTAYNLIKAKKYNDAVNALQSMLKKYPSGQFASNAHYWLGELYGLMGKNEQALNEFSSVVANYPESPRVSDAQLKVGLIFASQFKWSDAKRAFKQVINHYPGTASARLASEQLKQIRQSGH